MVAAHIIGTDNTQADALSIPEALIDLLMVSRPDWTTRCCGVLLSERLVGVHQEVICFCQETLSSLLRK